MRGAAPARGRPLFVQDAGAHESVADRVRVAVGGRPAVLQVALLLFGTVAWYPDAAAAVCNSCVQENLHVKI